MKANFNGPVPIRAARLFRQLLPPVPAGLAILAVMLLTGSHALSAQTASQGNTAAERFRHGIQAMREGKLEQAAEDFRKVVALQPGFAGAHFNLGLVHEQQGHFTEAVRDFKQALRIKPDLRGANLFQGIAWYKLNRFPQAQAAVAREVKLDPKDPKALMWLGVIELAEGNPEEAIAPLDKAAELDPRDIDILYHRGRAHLLVSKDSYEQMFKLDPNSWRVHQVLAQAYSESDRWADAIAEYKLAIQKASNAPGLHEGLGDAYRMSSQLDLAEKAYTRELEIDPHNVMAQFNLGMIRVERGNGKDALALLREVVKEQPGFASAHYYLGRGLAETGDHAAAVKQLQLVVREKPKGDLVQRSYYQLAMVYRSMKRPEEFRKAILEFQRLKAAADRQKSQSLEELKRAHAEQERKQKQ